MILNIEIGFQYQVIRGVLINKTSQREGEIGGHNKDIMIFLTIFPSRPTIILRFDIDAIIYPPAILIKQRRWAHGIFNQMPIWVFHPVTILSENTIG